MFTIKMSENIIENHHSYTICHGLKKTSICFDSIYNGNINPKWKPKNTHILCNEAKYDCIVSDDFFDFCFIACIRFVFELKKRFDSAFVSALLKMLKTGSRNCLQFIYSFLVCLSLEANPMCLNLIQLKRHERLKNTYIYMHLKHSCVHLCTALGRNSSKPLITHLKQNEFKNR